MDFLSPELRTKIGMAGDGMVYRRFVGEVRVKDEKKGIIRAPLSSLAEDSYKTITWWSPVEWDGEQYGLTHYLEDGEAAFLFEHGYTMKRERNPLGVIRNFDIVGDGRSADTVLEADFEFDIDNPVDTFPRAVFHQYQRGYRKGFSQGFRPVRVLDEEESNKFLEEQGRPERGVIVLLGEVLFEGSAVLFPANKQAKIKADQEILDLVERAIHQQSGVTRDDLLKLENKVKELEGRLTPQSLAELLERDNRVRFL